MKKKEKKWRSPSLGRDMELCVFGDTGTPILAIPTRGASCAQWGEQGMIESISHQIDSGFNQIICINSLDDESFFNTKISPRKRILRHQQYESYIIDEVVPFISKMNSIEFLIVAGVDTGGYHAINLGLKHPGHFGKVIGISGAYDIRPFLDDFYDDNVYYNNPVDFLPNLSNQVLLKKIRNVDFRLVSYGTDSRKDDTRRLATTLKSKAIEHRLDIWDREHNEEWDLWQEMLKVHII